MNIMIILFSMMAPFITSAASSLDDVLESKFEPYIQGIEAKIEKGFERQIAALSISDDDKIYRFVVRLALNEKLCRKNLSTEVWKVLHCERYTLLK